MQTNPTGVAKLLQDQSAPSKVSAAKKTKETSSVSPPEEKAEESMANLDDLVREMVTQCSCSTRLKAVKVKAGKYTFGDAQKAIFVR